MHIPKDDNFLEVEETEELINGKVLRPISSERQISTINRKKKTFASFNLQNATRIIGLVSTLVIVIMVIMNAEEEPLKKNLDHAILKNHSITNEEPANEGQEKFSVSQSITDIEEEKKTDGGNSNYKGVEEKEEKEVEIDPKEELTNQSIINEEPANEGQENPSMSQPITEIEEEKKTEVENSNYKGEEEKEEKEVEIDPKEELIAKWGKWTFWDGEEEIRPEGDYCGEYRHRDIPGNKFPKDAWQGDAVYVNHFLDAGLNLIERAKEAIYTEYGHSKEGLTRKQLLERSKMFHLEMLDLSKDTPAKEYHGGGWITEKSFEGLSRRLLHAMMTNDNFTVVMGGHSAAAGHGNHFQQSYMMSFHDFMEPIFKHMGVNLITRNLAHGGLGTLQSALGSGSIYGDEIDILVWDSSMTEKENRFVDLYYRQALLAGKRPPFLWNGNNEVLKMLHEEVGADVGHIGTGLNGIPETTDIVQAQNLTWASRFLKCGQQSQELCKENKFRTQCWIERPDVDPPTKQRKEVSGQASWHPGWRSHQLTGRVMAFTVLTVMQDAINRWSGITISEGMPLDEEYWHVSDYYDTMKKKVSELKLNPEKGFCEEWGSLGDLPERVCTTALKSRTEFTPRSDPENTSLTAIIKSDSDGHIPSLQEEMLYTGPDVPIPELQVPVNAIDIKAIISNRRRLTKDQLESDATIENTNFTIQNEKSKFMSQPLLRRRIFSDEIVPGSGWSLDTHPGICDGTYNTICGREPSSDCLLSGHMDKRGGIDGDGLSGWLILNINGVKEGIIMLKIETWHPASSNPATDGWENRNLKDEPSPYCDNFQFQYSINGTITSLNKDEFTEKIRNPQRVVEILTVMNDEEMAKDGKELNIELGIRLIGCKREKTFRLTHIYWA